MMNFQISIGAKTKTHKTTHSPSAQVKAMSFIGTKEKIIQAYLVKLHEN